MYGGKFEDENLQTCHDRAGLLSMANAGADSNGSQFFITLKATPHLNGKHVVFGEVTGGLDVVRKIELVDTLANDKPALGQEVRILWLCCFPILIMLACELQIGANP